MKTLKSVTSKDGLLSVVQRDNMLALRNGEIGYSCIYTDESVYQPILLPVQQVIESYAECHNVNHVAVLGGGCCTIPRFIIRRFNNSIQIDSVEYLSTIVELTKQYFLQGIATNRLNIVNEDAFHFIDNTTKKYDFIFVDMFVGQTWPKESKEPKFLTNLSQKTADDAIIMFNCYKLSHEQCAEFGHIGEPFIGKSYIIKDNDDSNYYVLFLKNECDEQCIKKYLL